jgi:LmbE family N-acetylglucosaminyl deacetylase
VLSLTLASLQGRSPSILLLGCHPDDIEIGCGGTVMRLLDAYDHVEVLWVVFSGRPDRAAEARASADAALERCSGARVIVGDFRDGFFPYQGAALKDFFEDLKAQVKPDLIFTHFGRDLHQDHRLVSELTWNTFRDHMILEYEVPKYDGDFGAPNMFVPLPRPAVDAKVNHLMEHFPTQGRRPWFTPDVFVALMRLRGMECASQSGFAEAFYSRKAVVLGG